MTKIYHSVILIANWNKKGNTIIGNSNVVEFRREENNEELIYDKFRFLDERLTEERPFNPTVDRDKTFLNRFPHNDALFCSLHAISKVPKAVVKETERVVSHVRQFNEEVARPLVM